MVQVVDDKSNTTSVAYDNLGRRTVIDNPDTGRTETQYDAASNVTKKITANLRAQAKTIDYAYDFNRLVSIKYPNFPGNDVTYTYGTPVAAGDANGNAAGRITRITSQMGVEERRYGRLGETVYEKKTVTTFTNALHPSVYETKFLFETFGRLLRITYPDGEVVTNAYDSGGNLKSAAGVKAVAASGQNHRYQYLQSLLYDKFEQRAFVEQGNGVKTAYTYDAANRRLNALTASRQGNTLFQNLSYSYDKVGNVLGLKNSVELPHANDYGGPSHQRFEYDELYRLTKAQGVFPSNVNAAAADASACAGVPSSQCRVYALNLGYDTIHNINTKTQADTRYPPGNPGGVVQKKTTYDFAYAYNASGPGSVRPHAPNHIGVRAFSYDANGNQTGWTHDQNGTRRNIVWDDENRIQSLFDNGHEKTYKYDDQGNRLIKRGPQGETVYVNQFFTDRPGANGTKHVYAGTARIASKLMRQDTPGANPNGKTPFEKDLYFYHPDHLGSSNYITDLNGKLYEHLEYFPFGEGWIEENTNVQRTPYLFTAKELDEETGLYYYGARYYDPRTSVWQSADPAIGKFLPMRAGTEAGLPGMGGVYNPFNLGAYTYGHQNPLRYVDPDGRFTLVSFFAFTAVVALAIIVQSQTQKQNADKAAAAKSNDDMGMGAGRDRVKNWVFNESSEGKKDEGKKNEGKKDDADAKEDPKPESDIKIDDKIKGQLEGRGWTEEEVRDVTKTEPIGTSTDNTKGQNDPATVYGSKDLRAVNERSFQYRRYLHDHLCDLFAVIRHICIRRPELCKPPLHAHPHIEPAREAELGSVWELISVSVQPGLARFPPISRRDINVRKKSRTRT